MAEREERLVGSKHPGIRHCYDSYLAIKVDPERPNLGRHPINFDGSQEAKLSNIRTFHTLARKKIRMPLFDLPFHVGPCKDEWDQTWPVQAVVKGILKQSPTGIVPINVTKEMSWQGIGETTEVPARKFRPLCGEILSGASRRKDRIVDADGDYVETKPERADVMGSECLMAIEAMVIAKARSWPDLANKRRNDPMIAIQVPHEDEEEFPTKTLRDPLSRQEIFHEVIKVNQRHGRENGDIWDVKITLEVQEHEFDHEDETFRIPVLMAKVVLAFIETKTGISSVATLSERQIRRALNGERPLKMKEREARCLWSTLFPRIMEHGRIARWEWLRWVASTNNTTLADMLLWDKDEEVDATWNELTNMMDDKEKLTVMLTGQAEYNPVFNQNKKQTPWAIFPKRYAPRVPELAHTPATHVDNNLVLSLATQWWDQLKTNAEQAGRSESLNQERGKETHDGDKKPAANERKRKAGNLHQSKTG